ncbi:MAG TPA: T9SS type A sorting domain-containing protein, partial [Ferruginibacter sp.]|nr:T9SS type A sorting domain-containing protein [Ferruginibacter sp.]
GFWDNTTPTSTRSYLRNQIYNLYTNLGASGAICGILSQNGGNVTIANNVIHSLFPGQEGVGAAFAKGISINAGTTSMKIYNNMISLDLSQAFAPAGNSRLIGSNAVAGIDYVAGSATATIYYNSIRLAGAGSGTAFGSSGISMITATATFDLRNNIVSNVMTPGGVGAGVSAALRNTSSSTYLAASNNNDWYTTQTATTPLYYNGTAFATLAAFKASVTPRESNSLADFPDFEDVALNDLHLKPGSNCGLDGNAQYIATYTDDVDATNIRDLNAPDIGADEFDATGGGTGTWKGVNTNWMDVRNWCGSVPTVTTDVIIPARASGIYPIITTTAPVARNITINATASLTIDNGGQLANKGTWLNNGTLTNNGTIVLNGTTNQAFPNSASVGTLAAMNNLTVNNPAGATLDQAFTIEGVLKPKNGIITLNNVLITLQSLATGTASVDTVEAGAGFTYNGVNAKFSVERYIASATNPAWRFLAAPITGAQTINQAWQEGQVAPTYTATGFGMQIVGPGSTALGFDVNNSLTSVKTYSPVINNWVSIPNTNSTPISTNEGYMAFVRGDRGSNTFGSMSATRLRMAGPIKTGPVTVSTADANVGRFISVGNPYPSAIDYASPSTVKTGLQDVYYIWDPALGTYGAYQTFLAPFYDATPGGGSYGGGNKFIESGQAFFVRANNSVAPHSITINEQSKVGSNQLVTRVDLLGKKLSTRLFVGTGSNAALFDGNRVYFDAAFTNAVDDGDAIKMTNFGESIGILRDGHMISVERRAEIVNTDTIFYALGQLKQQDYQLELTAENLASPMLTAYLEDAFLNSSTVIDLNVVSNITFTVTADPASRAANRFRLVFKQLGPVPLTFSSISAIRQDRNILVSWKVANELNISKYEVEHSSNGRNFSLLGTQVARGNGAGTTLQYSLLDIQPFAGDNFFRVRSIGFGTDTKYSEIVKVNMAENASMISVYPNPVKDGNIGLNLNNLPKADYDLNLYGVNGQLVLRQRINHPGGSQRLMVPVGMGYAKGVYTLEMINKVNGDKRYFKIVLE